MTEEQINELKMIAQQKRDENRKKIVSLRISNETLEKAKKFGRGYTGILSRLLDIAIDDPDMLKKCI